ncbi:HIRAN domain-containing protein [Clostridium sp. JN-9]|uniref:HIRAN domain-containing protein n=1 Tax=Clostridium sp. JN-9 TaxID=2507159 RepID=UPI000FFE28BF|nr:HIRAN domain-containing protein [Clostridium sp. JN-9]QAT39749.1 hypothetical protein EQM05_05510 [Clostridium sp. JN-9]
MLVKGESIFQEIYRYLKENPDSIYEDQDFETAGLEDSYYIFFGEILPDNIQKAKAENLLKILNNYLENESEHNKLLNFLNEDRFITYYFEFCRLLKLYILEDLINVEKLADIGIKLSTCSSNYEEVKVGITILGLCEPENSRKIVEILGMHSEFTFYSVTSTGNWDHYNTFVFNLAKRTCGYGKVHCLKNLYALNDEIKQWIIEQGSMNVVLKEISAVLCTKKVNISWYLKSRNIGRNELSKVSSIIYYILSEDDYDIYENEDSLETVKLYIKYAEKYAHCFHDLCAVAYIEERMRPYLTDDEASSKRKNGWTITIEKEIKNKCLSILINDKWKTIFKESLKKADEPGKVYMFISEVIGLKLTFDELMPILEKDKYNIDVYLYLSEGKNANNMKQLINYAYKTLPLKKIFSGAVSIDEEHITTDCKPDICIYCILRNLSYCSFVDMELPTMALKARFPENREEAVHYLKKHKENWNNETVSKIKEAIGEEKSQSIKRKMKELLNINGTKKREYTNVSNLLVKPFYKDIYLFSTDIAGVLYRDTSVIEDNIKINDMLFLKHDTNNPYDENAVMVTDNTGYILGYIPRGANKQLKNLLKGGKYLYGRLKKCSFDDNYMNIDVYLSYKDVQESIKDTITAMDGEADSLKQ